MEGAYPVKGMGDLETEEIIDTDMVRGSGRVCIARLDFEVGKRGHRVVIEYVDVYVGNESAIQLIDTCEVCTILVLCLRGLFSFRQSFLAHILRTICSPEQECVS